MKCFVKRAAIAGASAALVLLALPAIGSAQYYNYRGPSSLVRPYYNGANTLYQQQMRRRGIQNPGSIGSPQFFRRNFPRPSWQDYSRSTGGVFVRPRNCFGPYC